MKTIRVSQLREPERYQALYEAMMNGTEVEGGYVMEYTEYHEAGELVCKFLLRPTEESQTDGNREKSGWATGP